MLSRNIINKVIKIVRQLVNKCVIWAEILS